MYGYKKQHIVPNQIQVAKHIMIFQRVNGTQKTLLPSSQIISHSKNLEESDHLKFGQIYMIS
jgi:hypothetical protein